MPVAEDKKEDPRVKMLMEKNPWMDFMIAETLLNLSDAGELQKFNEKPHTHTSSVPSIVQGAITVVHSADTLEAGTDHHHPGPALLQ